MRATILATLFGAGLLLAPFAYAQTAAVTATCKDGTAFSGTSRKGACRGHKGVATWGAAAESTNAAATPAAASTAPAAPTPLSNKTATSTAAAKPGAPGQVWVNTASKVYHCPGDRYYGKTKAGEYMSQSAAQAAGDRPSGGKVCPS